MTGVTETFFADLPDRIYEAAFVPTAWPGVLAALSRLTGSASGSIVVFQDGEAARYAATGPVADVLARLAPREDWLTSYSVSQIQAVPPPAFAYDGDYFPAAMLEADPLRRPILREHGLAGQSATLLPLMTGEKVLITVEHASGQPRPSREELARLDELRPHLARAALIAARMRLRAAEDTVSALGALGLPAAVLGRDGQVLAANDLLGTLGAVLRIGARDRVALAGAGAQALFVKAMEATARHGVVRSLPVTRPEADAAGGHATVVIHLLPLRRRAHEIFGVGGTLLVATQADPSASAPAPAILANLFDLTVAESRLAASLAAGLSLQDAAARGGIRFATARSYLERVFRKTGTNRQGELIALIRSAQPFRIED
jgi:DNA-binding CsgD family transcriptional regulator